LLSTCLRASLPAKCYTFTPETGRLDVAYENCLECGTCLIICEKQAVEWQYRAEATVFTTG